MEICGWTLKSYGNLWVDTEIRRPEPAEKRQKFRIGWTRRAATKTTNIPDLLLLLVVGCLRVAQRPPEGAKKGKKEKKKKIS